MKTALTTLLTIWLLAGCGKKKASNPVIEKAAQMSVKEMTEDEKRFEEMKTLAEKGDATAQLYLGACYFQAQGVKKDNITAYVWWKISADKGNEKAKAGKVLVSKDMTPDQIAKAEALAKEMIKKNPKLIQ